MITVDLKKLEYHIAYLDDELQQIDKIMHLLQQKHSAAACSGNTPDFCHQLYKQISFMSETQERIYLRRKALIRTKELLQCGKKSLDQAIDNMRQALMY